MQALPVTIRKTWFGYLVIFLAGASVIGLTWAGISSVLSAPGIDMMLVFGLAALIIIFTLAITIIQLYVYSLSFITLTTDGIVVKNWITLFDSTDMNAEWVRVSRATVSKGGIFAQLIDYGTLSVETNGGSVQVTIKMIPNVEYWQRVIAQKADQATVDGTDT
jgi:hypothetical protein